MGELAVSASDEYFNLGSFQRIVSTTSSEAQTWFNRGLAWSYAFNHDEAAECFEQAILMDPKCSLAYWGLAYAMGPNYNKSWDVFSEPEREAAVKHIRRAEKQAKLNDASTSAAEHAIIDAIQYRYPRNPASGGESSEWNKNYADAMELVYQRFPDDLDVAALCVDALMSLTPWKLWDLKTGQPAPAARTLRAKEIIEGALAQNDGLKHPGLIHLYIHLMEMSGSPETALPAANHLRGLIPDAGHLQHMPSHLDILCGDYQNAINSNSRAILADEKFVARAGSRNFYALYRCHNYHFRIYAAMFAAQSKIALETVAQLEAAISEGLLRVKSPPMADWLEGILGSRVHVIIRFGLWKEAVNLKLPEDEDLYPVTTTMVHYAKGVALAVTGRIEESAKERHLFSKALERVPSARILFNNKCTDILAIAAAMFDGELEYRRGNFDAAFAHLRRSIVLDDSLPYDEPWGWMQPTRHAYGALLLEQGHIEEATVVYSADLGVDNTLPRARRHPNNVWALHGYHECLLKLGRTDEARAVEPQLKRALAAADVPIGSSCFCRLGSGH